MNSNTFKIPFVAIGNRIVQQGKLVSLLHRTCNTHDEASRIAKIMNQKRNEFDKIIDTMDI